MSHSLSISKNGSSLAPFIISQGQHCSGHEHPSLRILTAIQNQGIEEKDQAISAAGLRSEKST